MNSEDRDYLEGKFDSIQGRITQEGKELREKIYDLKTSLDAHKATPCPDVDIHERRYHGTRAKERGAPVSYSFLGKLVGLLALAIGAIVALAKMVTK